MKLYFDIGGMAWMETYSHADWQVWHEGKFFRQLNYEELKKIGILHPMQAPQKVVEEKMPTKTSVYAFFQKET